MMNVFTAGATVLASTSNVDNENDNNTKKNKQQRAIAATMPAATRAAKPYYLEPPSPQTTMFLISAQI